MLCRVLYRHCKGQVPGVIITRSSGAPGDESWGMKLRGAVSANSTDPLIIIDGVEYESVNELRLLNSADIESINFLKDASAAIYGSEGSRWCYFGDYQTG